MEKVYVFNGIQSNVLVIWLLKDKARKCSETFYDLRLFLTSGWAADVFIPSDENSE